MLEVSVLHNTFQRVSFSGERNPLFPGLRGSLQYYLGSHEMIQTGKIPTVGALERAEPIPKGQAETRQSECESARRNRLCS